MSFDRVWSTGFCPGTPRRTWSISSPTRACRPQTPPCPQPPRRPTSTSALRPAPCPTTTPPTPVSPARERKESAGPLPGARPLSSAGWHTQVCVGCFQTTHFDSNIDFMIPKCRWFPITWEVQPSHVFTDDTSRCTVIWCCTLVVEV